MKIGLLVVTKWFDPFFWLQIKRSPKHAQVAHVSPIEYKRTKMLPSTPKTLPECSQAFGHPCVYLGSSRYILSQKRGQTIL